MSFWEAELKFSAPLFLCPQSLKQAFFFAAAEAVDVFPVGVKDKGREKQANRN